MIPLEKSKPLRKNPSSLLIYGSPKIGKTELVAQLDNFLLTDLENGSDFAEAMKVKLVGFKANGKEEEKDKKKRLQEGKMYFSELYLEITKYKKENGDSPYKGIIVDTITELESWCESDATYDYMGMSQGKRFNRYSEKELTKRGIEPFLENGLVNPKSVVPKGQFKSVLTLPNGGGYLHLRNAFKKWKGVFDDLAEHKIFIAHVKDIFLEKKGREVSAKDLDLTGKIKNITCASVDAIGFVYRDFENPLELRISFKNNDKDLVGSRARHLRNQDFVIAVNNKDGTIKEHFWNRIFIE